MADSMSTTVVAGDTSRAFFGHPRGLATLFFTEMWERFTYYGMRAILVLFLVASIEEGGLGVDDRTGNAIYGLYISGTYLLSLAGGWIADRLTGAQRAVWWGGILIMVGNGLLATGSKPLFFLGLMLIVFGVGLLKPNISAIVAQLYPEGGARRDAGYYIFYMGINVGAFLGSTLVPILADHFGWRMGFAAPAVGMFFGLTQFAVTRRYLGHAGVEPGMSHADPAATQRAWWIVAAVVTAIVAAVWRGRRFGPLVEERLPVTVRASETMHGRARLTAQTGDSAHAAAALRDGAVRRLGKRLGLSQRATPAQIAYAIPHEPALSQLFTGPLPANDAELASFARALGAILDRVDPLPPSEPTTPPVSTSDPTDHPNERPIQ